MENSVFAFNAFSYDFQPLASGLSISVLSTLQTFKRISTSPTQALVE